MNLDPKLRERLLQESKTPFLGVRRLIWVALFGSAGLGFLIMSTRLLVGETVPPHDLAIQILALLLFGGLIVFDRRREL